MAKWPNVPQFCYRSGDINLNLNHSTETKLDSLLKKRWENAQSSGVFRYALNIQDAKVLPGKYGFFVQVNEERASLRRKPQAIQQINCPFDPTLFNFTHLKEEEILFSLKYEAESEQISSYVAVNASPLEYGHSLLLPSLEDCHPQVINENGLTLALTFMLISGSLDLRVGFNGLCAFASVNHQHYHAYYLKNRMLLERIAVHHLRGPCFELREYPAEGFAFQLLELDVNSFVRSVLTLTNYLQENGIAHNLFLTRGTEFKDHEKAESLVNGKNIVRVYVWARKPTHGAKEVEAFNPALCELFGHFPIKSVESYKKITEEFVSEVLHDICHEVFLSVRDKVALLFSES
ncbi:GDP-D-glucose phosphorylase 1 [Hetaerina americana]|uniref:GDP-D-glucose phosphorylase 1 n=1 Tax=Hetaerina americana TaxID=62018 RepID=UPI003A7F52EB